MLCPQTLTLQFPHCSLLLRAKMSHDTSQSLVSFLHFIHDNAKCDTVASRDGIQNSGISIQSKLSQGAPRVAR